MYIDTHVHLNDQRFLYRLDDIINEAMQVGVTKFICVGYNKETSRQALKLAKQYNQVYASIGFHPTEVKDLTDDDYQWLEENGHHEKVVAIGECGFDFHWQTTSKDEQHVAFVRQIAIAKRLGKPLIIHSREAMQLTLDVLIEQHAREIGGVMHSYSGSKEMVPQFIKENFMIGIGGPVTFLNAKAPKEVVETIDVNYLLSETDAPYLAPHPYRGKENRPVYIPLIVEQMASLKGMEKATLAKIIMNNAQRLFNI